VRPLPGNEFCCGAAGTYMLQQPALSDALLAEKLSALRQDPPDFLLTSNPGCSLQLARGARELGLKTRVLHPLELLERQLVIDT
jgi:glycolate oxidase iron-sulfur subunit